MKIIVCDSTKEIDKLVANEFIKVLKEKPNATLGLATGSSPVGVYQELIEANKAGDIDFSNVKTFNLDEYCGIDQSHSQSYYNFMHENLFNHININKENINIPTVLTDINQSCQDYADRLAQNNIDIQILGIGSNGHIAFNEPGGRLDSTVHVVELDQKTREDNSRFFTNIDEVPTHAITMGLSDILSAKKIVLIATGSNKAKAIKGLVEGEITADLPASVLQKHPDTTIFVDKQAASLLND